MKYRCVGGPFANQWVPSRSVLATGDTLQIPLGGGKRATYTLNEHHTLIYREDI